MNFLSLLVVGDRWKGENVATSEVADILMMANGILEANVYGVKVEGKTLKAELVAHKKLSHISPKVQLCPGFQNCPIRS